MAGENHLVERLRAGSRGREEATFAELPGGARRRYADLFDEATRIAVVLRASGLEPGDRVAAQVEKSLSAIALYLGTVMAGGVFLPLKTKVQKAALRAAYAETFAGRRAEAESGKG
jgi:malonyl-CoA/methylmalonyl-CoA synthetase